MEVHPAVYQWLAQLKLAPADVPVTPTGRGGKVTLNEEDSARLENGQVRGLRRALCYCMRERGTEDTRVQFQSALGRFCLDHE